MGIIRRSFTYLDHTIIKLFTQTIGETTLTIYANPVWHPNNKKSIKLKLKMSSAEQSKGYCAVRGWSMRRD